MKKPTLREVVPVFVSVVAFLISITSFLLDPKKHSDILTSDVIASAYTDLGTQYPLHGHLFCLAGEYNKIRTQVEEATRKRISDESERAQLLLEERSVAQRIFTMYEHYYFLWDQAKRVKDKNRAEFLKKLLDYFTAKVLTNPRLLWYWSSSGGGLVEHCEVNAINYYKMNVKANGAAIDPSGPFTPSNTPINRS